MRRLTLVRLLIVVLAATLAACNLSVPEVTPTVAPTLTASATPPSTSTTAPTRTPSRTPTHVFTATSSPTDTPLPTDTGTPLPTATWTRTITPVPTNTPLPTDTPSPTDTGTPRPTATWTRTITPAPTNTPLPTDTPTPTDTGTPRPTATWTRTITPAPTNTPLPTDTPTLTETVLPSPLPLIASVTPSPAPTHTIPPSFTPLPTPSLLPPPGTPLLPLGVRTPTALPSAAAPTPVPLGFRTPTPVERVEPTIILHAPPTVITAAPGTIPAQVTPFEVETTPTGIPQGVTLTALPLVATPLALASPTLPPIVSVTQIVPADPLTRAFSLSTAEGFVTGDGVTLPFAATDFARNPANPNEIALVDPRGLLYLNDGESRRLDTSPFSNPEPQTSADNPTRVTQVGWSPDGAWLAFLIDSEHDDRDGVWLFDGSASHQIFRECPPPIEQTCTVDREGEPTHYNTLHFAWNSTSTGILIELDLPDEGRHALTLVTPDSDPTHKTPTYRYDYGSWSWDGARILASGSGEDGRTGLRWIDPLSGSVQLIFDSGARGLWLQNAVERVNGQIVALGSPNGKDSPQSLYAGDGQVLTPPIGDAPPVRVEWSPDRTAVLVVVADPSGLRYYVAEINGAVREITASVAGALAVEWIGAPSGGAVQSQYGLSVGAQVQVHAPAGVVMRIQPSTTAAAVGSLNTYDWVTIIGGPTRADGLIWWRVQASNAIGWAAEGNGVTQLLSTEALP